MTHPPKPQYKPTELGELIELVYGQPLASESRSGREYPVFGSNGQVGSHNIFLVEGAGIVIGRKGSAGQVSWAEKSHWVIDTAFYVKRKNNLDLRWLYYMLCMSELDKLILESGVPGLNRNDVYRLKIILPPLEQQQKIAEILGSVDQNIQAHKRVVEGLEAARKGFAQAQQGLGISPEEQTKLGRKLIGIGHFAEIAQGYTFPPHLQGKRTGKYLFSKVSDMTLKGNEKYIRSAINHVDDSDVEELGARIFPAQTVVFPRVGAALRTNKKRILERAGLVDDNQVAIITNSKMCLPEFLHACLESTDLSIFSNDGPLPSITRMNVSRHQIWLPDLREQQRTVNSIQAFDQNLEAERAKLAQLSELKRGLMQGLLTGRVRVEGGVQG